MFFNGGQGLHGSYEVVRANVSHGCVRLHVDDARWLRYNFVDGPNMSNGYRGTKVIIRPY
jgi:lipoprotein-anchoring transpeptidase ErfK/SrfK